MQKKVFIGCGAGFSGDRFDASIPIVKEFKRINEPKYLMFEVLAERTLAIAQQYRIKNPEEGYSPFLDSYITPIIEDCLQNNIKIISLPKIISIFFFLDNNLVNVTSRPKTDRPNNIK